MSKFDESQHPRNAQGRFVAKKSAIPGVVLGVVLLGMIVHGTPGSAGARVGLQFTRVAHDRSRYCAAHSHGKVRRYLHANPCVRLSRSRYTVSDADGHTMVVATQTVTMTTAGRARKLRRLVDRPRTGNIDKLGAGFSATHFATRLDDTIVRIAEAQPHGLLPVPGHLLDAAATKGLDPSAA